MKTCACCGQPLTRTLDQIAERRAKARELFAAGTSVKEIAASYEVSERTVYGWIGEAVKAKRDRAAEGRRRYLAGEKVVALAHEYGVEPETVYRWIKDVPKRKPETFPRFVPAPQRAAA